MAPISLQELCEYLDDFLRVGETPDFKGAMNGLQVDGANAITTIAAAVDACERTIEGAASAGANLLLVHHGLFWDAPFRMTGMHYRRFSKLIREGISVYSAHLPLDVHPVVGNNAVLARGLGIPLDGGFSEYEGVTVGGFGPWVEPREKLVGRIAEQLRCEPRLLPFGPETTGVVGILTGAGGSAVREASALGIDTLITGEAAHPVFFHAEENRMNLILAGHYATETVGVGALAEHLAAKFSLEHVFLDHPTGL